MKQFKNILLGVTVLSLLFLGGCKEDTPAPSAKKVLQDALTTGTYTIDPVNSDISGVTGKPGVADATVTFTATEAGASFTLGGEVAAYIKSGTFDISDTGSASNPAVTVASDLVVNDVVLAEASATKFRISITTGKAGGRLTGVGSYTLTFNNAN